MEKIALRIYEGLGIALKQSNTLLLFKSVIIVSCVWGLGTALFLTLWQYEFNKIVLIVLGAIGTLLASYLCVSYFLSAFIKTNRLLDALLKDTLHELNIPLSVIKANTQMLQNNEIDEKKLRRLERITLASDDLYELYKEVDYHIKKEMHHDQRERFMLDDIVHKIVSRHKEVYAESEIVFQPTSLALLTERIGLSKIISNILHNAIKYNQNNAPIVIKHDGMSLVIQDKGIGMSEEEIFLVFNRYYQVDESKEGYGIGLSLVKAYCDELRIPFRIQSHKGEGTTVFLDLSYVVEKGA